MQTNFTAAQLADPNIREADAIIRDCVHYGFCTAVCPTYVLLGDELDAPRGRIDLIKAMLEAGAAPSAKTVGHLDRCLSCLACVTTCAARVDYMHLIDRARIFVEEHYRRPLADRLMRWMLASLVPHPARFRLALRLAALARPLSRVLPRRLANLVDLAPSRLPPHAASAGTRIVPAEGARKMRVALLSGCVQQVIAPHITEAAIRVLARHGCEVVVSPDAICCGALTLHMGKEATAKSSARRTIAAWTREIAGDGLDAIVVTASGCGTTVKDYAHLFAHEPHIAAEAKAIAGRALDISELLRRVGFQAPEDEFDLAIAYHDACSLQHGQRVTAEPRALLATAGFLVRDVPEKHFCCGSAGAYNMLEPEIAARLGARKVENIAATGARAIAAGNLGCMVQIGRFTDLPVLHTVELLDWASGGPKPAALGSFEIARTKPAQRAKEAVSVAADSSVAIW